MITNAIFSFYRNPLSSFLNHGYSASTFGAIKKPNEIITDSLASQKKCNLKHQSHRFSTSHSRKHFTLHLNSPACAASPQPWHAGRGYMVVLLSRERISSLRLFIFSSKALSLLIEKSYKTSGNINGTSCSRVEPKGVSASHGHMTPYLPNTAPGLYLLIF